MAEEREKKCQPVVKAGSATKKPQSTGKSFLQEFIVEDCKSIRDYLIFDVLIPASKNAISDLVTGGVDMLLFGSAGGRRSTRSSGTNYSTISTNRAGGQKIIRYEDNNKPANPRVSNNGTFRYNDIYFRSRGEAEAVLSAAIDTLEKYEALSVADLYDICGMDSDYTDNKYGWTNLNGACVQRTSDGFMIKMPRVEVL